MQKQITKRLTQNTRRKLLKVGIARQGIVRQRTPKATNIAPICRNGLFTLRLKPIAAYKILSLFDLVDSKTNSSFNLIGDLYPAYLQFLKLNQTPAKDILKSEFPINTMFTHIEQVIGQGNELNVFHCTTENMHYFNYLTPIAGGNEYCVFTYAPVVRVLKEQKEWVYTKLLHKSLMSLRKMGIARWDDLCDFILDWIGDEEEWESQNLEYEDILSNRKLRRKYESGDAAKAITRLHKYKPLCQADIDTINVSLDREHPVSQFAIEVFELSKSGKNIYDYCDEPDDDVQEFILYPDTFCLYYELDRFFELHEEYVNDQAREGVQEPRVSTKITAEMTELPDTGDSFPHEMVMLFYKHADIETQLTEYYKLKSHE